MRDGSSRPGHLTRGLPRAGLLCLLLLPTLPVRTAAADDDLSSDARTIHEAIRSGDARGLSTLAEQWERDPWRLVDELAAAGHADSATTYADAIQGPGQTALRAYARKRPPDRERTRSVIRAVLRSIDSSSPTDLLARLADLEPPARSVLRLRLHSLRGRLLLESEKPDESRREYAAAARVAGRIGRDAEAEARLLIGRFRAARDTEDNLALERIATQLAELSRMAGNAWQASIAELNLGGVFLELGLPSRALGVLVRARRRFTVEGASQDPETAFRATAYRAGADRFLCIGRSLLGDFPRALAAGERSAEAFRELDLPIEAARTLRELANAHADYGGFSEALRLYREALGLLRDAEDGEVRLERLRLRVNEGHALQELGRVDEAKTVLRRALDDLAATGAEDEVTVALINLGEALEKEGAWADALHVYANAARIAKLDPVLSAYIHLRRGDTLSRRGASRDPEALAAADASYRRALDIVGDRAEPGLAMLALLGRGEILLARGQPGKALEVARSALDRLESMTEGLADGEMIDAREHSDRQRILGLAIRAAAAASDGAALFEMLERSRAHAFLAALGGRQALLRHLLAPDQASALARARARLNAAYVMKRRARASGGSEGIAKVTRVVVQAQEAHDRLLSRLEREARLLGGAMRPPPSALADVQAALTKNRAIVLYSLVAEGPLALVVTKAGARATPLASRTEVVAACEQWKNACDGGTAEAFTSALSGLRKLLVDPLELPASLEQILVSPDGVLAHMPWPLILPTGETRRPDVSLIPSASVYLALLPRTGRRGMRRIAVGDPEYRQNDDTRTLRVYAHGRPLARLRASGREVEAVTGDGDVRLLRSSATEADLFRALGQRPHWRALHLACHGILNHHEPSLSCLALSPSKTGDGFLTALEIYGRSIPADLVVLSACETGRDRAATGEGLLGLARAFMLAGSPRVIASLRKVNDAATRSLMERFYAEWDKPGVSTAEALRRAQAHTAVEWPDPADWGVWVLWGLPD